MRISVARRVDFFTCRVENIAPCLVLLFDTETASFTPGTFQCAKPLRGCAGVYKIKGPAYATVTYLPDNMNIHVRSMLKTTGGLVQGFPHGKGSAPTNKLSYPINIECRRV